MNIRITFTNPQRFLEVLLDLRELNVPCEGACDDTAFYYIDILGE